MFALLTLLSAVVGVKISIADQDGSQVAQTLMSQGVASFAQVDADLKGIESSTHQKLLAINNAFEKSLPPLPPITVTPSRASSFLEQGAPDSFADLDAKLKQLEEKTKSELAKLNSETAAPSSLLEKGAPDSFADIDAKLKQLEEKTKSELAKLNSETASPSSLLEKGSPDSFADIDAKLKQLQEKTKAELSKLNAETAAPSSLLEKAPNSFADIDAKLKQLEEKTKAELAKLNSDTAAPSSLLEKGSPDSFSDLDAKLKQLEQKTKAELAKLNPDAAPSSFIQDTDSDTDEQAVGSAQLMSTAVAGFANVDADLKKIEARTQQQVQSIRSKFESSLHDDSKFGPSSFIEVGSPDSFADLDAKLKQLEEKTKSELAKLNSGTASPSSFIQKASPDSFADIDAKLKQLEEKTKAELAKLNADTAAPSSLLEKGSPDSFADIDAKLKQLEEKTKAELAKLNSASPSSLIEESPSFNEVDAHLKKIESTTKDELASIESRRKKRDDAVMHKLGLATSLIQTGKYDDDNMEQLMSKAHGDIAAMNQMLSDTDKDAAKDTASSLVQVGASNKYDYATTGGDDDTPLRPNDGKVRPHIHNDDGETVRNATPDGENVDDTDTVDDTSVFSTETEENTPPGGDDDESASLIQVGTGLNSHERKHEQALEAKYENAFSSGFSSELAKTAEGESLLQAPKPDAGSFLEDTPKTLSTDPVDQAEGAFDDLENGIGQLKNKIDTSFHKVAMGIASDGRAQLRTDY